MTIHLPCPSQPTPPHVGAFAPLPAELLDDPMAYLDADHARQQRLCVLLGQWAERGRIAAVDGAAAVGHLRHELALHRQDEEDDLFPLLRARCDDAELATVLDRHARDLRLDDGIRLELAHALAQDAATETRRLAATTRSLMLAFATRHARRVLVETSRFISRARSCLVAADVDHLSACMKARRLATA